MANSEAACLTEWPTIVYGTVALRSDVMELALMTPNVSSFPVSRADLSAGGQKKAKTDTDVSDTIGASSACGPMAWLIHPRVC